MTRIFCYSIVLFCIVNLSLNLNPGAKMRVTQKWVDYVKTVGIQFLREMLRNEPLPDITGATHMFGAVDYFITGIQVDMLELHKSTATLMVGTDVEVSFDDASAKAHGKWRVKHWLVKNKGRFALSLTGVNIKATLTTFQDDSNRPGVLLSKCQSNVQRAEIKFSGSLSWLYNLFSVFLEKPICDNLSKRLCHRVEEEIAELQRVLKTFRAHARIGALADVDYSLLMPPQVTTEHIDLDLKGMVSPVGSPSESPFTPRTIPMPNSNQFMLLLGFSESFFHSVSFTYFTKRVLRKTITHKESPKTPWLKTSDYVKQIPEISNHYPKAQPMRMSFYATKVPMVTLTPDRLHLELFGLVEATALLPDSNTKPLFAVNLGVSLSSSDLRVSDFNLTGSFRLNSYQLLSISSSLGFVENAAFDEPVQFMLISEVLPALNEGLMSGIPVPSLANISLTDTEVKINQGSVLISTDMVYLPFMKSLNGRPRKDGVGRRSASPA
ncbi:bactericidal permeability-increasing protein-like [Ambystoma mexicanum]|uniref:bactericidal permeability-increasing protein-like n=1 Tax=Ambystoma mexicanum TaxID=8296 RepID=UPI0037E9BE64